MLYNDYIIYGIIDFYLGNLRDVLKKINNGKILPIYIEDWFMNVLFD